VPRQCILSLQSSCIIRYAIFNAFWLCPQWEHAKINALPRICITGMCIIGMYTVQLCTSLNLDLKLCKGRPRIWVCSTLRGLISIDAGLAEPGLIRFWSWVSAELPAQITSTRTYKYIHLLQSPARESFPAHRLKWRCCIQPTMSRLRGLCRSLRYVSFLSIRVLTMIDPCATSTYTVRIVWFLLTSSSSSVALYTTQRPLLHSWWDCSHVFASPQLPTCHLARHTIIFAQLAERYVVRLFGSVHHRSTHALFILVDIPASIALDQSKRTFYCYAIHARSPLDRAPVSCVKLQCMWLMN